MGFLGSPFAGAGRLSVDEGLISEDNLSDLGECPPGFQPNRNYPDHSAHPCTAIPGYVPPTPTLTPDASGQVVQQTGQQTGQPYQYQPGQFVQPGTSYTAKPGGQRISVQYNPQVVRSGGSGPVGPKPGPADQGLTTVSTDSGTTTKIVLSVVALAGVAAILYFVLRRKSSATAGVDDDFEDMTAAPCPCQKKRG